MRSQRSRRKLIGKVLAAASAVCALSAVASAPVWAACSANFTCGIGESSKCYFAVADGRNKRFFTVGAGGAKRLYGLHSGAVYCSSSHPLNMGRCVGSLKIVKLRCD
jgi:hypothetical protein